MHAIEPIAVWARNRFDFVAQLSADWSIQTSLSFTRLFQITYYDHVERVRALVISDSMRSARY